MKNIFFIVLISFGGISLQAQTEEERLATIEQGRLNEKQRLLQLKFDSAIALMDAGEYTTADIKFRQVLQGMKSVPSDLTFYFGENSFYLNQNRQAIDWLNKYIQLKGTAGKFYARAIALLKEAENGLATQKTGEIQNATEILSRNFDIDCGPTGKVVCPVCAGSTVIVKRTYLGDKYQTCGHCNKTGHLSCDDYNKLLRGQLPTPK